MQEIWESTIQSIIKSFRESAEIFASNGEGLKTILNTHDLRFHRWHCIKNQHDSMKDITAGAQECFGLPLSVPTICYCIYKVTCLPCKSQAIHKLCRETILNYLGSSFSENWHKFEMCPLVWWAHISEFLDVMHIVAFGLKSKRTIQIVTNAKKNSQHHWWYGGVLTLTS